MSLSAIFPYLISRINTLSLDVVLGAVASGGMAARLLDVDMPTAWWLVFPLSVWVMYTTDHLMDAYRLKDRAHTVRHRFHYRYFRPIAWVWVASFLFCLLGALFHLPKQMVHFGLFMGGCVLVHLALVRWIGDRVSHFFHKELGVGLIYTAGVWGGPFSLADELSTGAGLACAQFFLLAMFNLLLFSLYEIRSDELDGHTSFVRAIGAAAARKVLLALGAGIAGLGAIALAGAGESSIVFAVQAIYAAMLGLLLAIAFLPRYFGKQARYRSWGDALFVLPALIWLL